MVGVTPYHVEFLTVYHPTGYIDRAEYLWTYDTLFAKFGPPLITYEEPTQ